MLGEVVDEIQLLITGDTSCLGDGMGVAVSFMGIVAGAVASGRFIFLGVLKHRNGAPTLFKAARV
jgi:hypothetical protein